MLQSLAWVQMPLADFLLKSTRPSPAGMLFTPRVIARMQIHAMYGQGFTALTNVHHYHKINDNNSKTCYDGCSISSRLEDASNLVKLDVPVSFGNAQPGPPCSLTPQSWWQHQRPAAAPGPCRTSLPLPARSQRAPGTDGGSQECRFWTPIGLHKPERNISNANIERGLASLCKTQLVIKGS